MASNNQKPKPNTSLFREQKIKRQQNQRPSNDENSSDSHDLFLKTFSACRGEKYTPYDYNRHMQGQEEREEYNSFIRINHSKAWSVPKTVRHPLGHFEEWTKHQKNVSMLPVHSVLSDPKLNSERGLQKILRKEKTHKVVIVNHQCRPVNYYLKQTASTARLKRS